MVLGLIVAIVVYALLLYVIELLNIPDPGPRVAKIAVSILFFVYVLNAFGVLHMLDRP